jgi:hypothetical protein
VTSNLLTIIPPEGEGVQLANGTRFVLADGTEVTQVTRCVVAFGVDEPITATLDLAINPRQPIEAQPLLSRATLEEAAKHYGLRLVEINMATGTKPHLPIGAAGAPSSGYSEGSYVDATRPSFDQLREE